MDPGRSCCGIGAVVCGVESAPRIRDRFGVEVGGLAEAGRVSLEKAFVASLIRGERTLLYP